MTTEWARDKHGEGLAVIDRSGRYRYLLQRVWDSEKPVLAWCMLNPSTADASTSDRTLDRVVGFSTMWGFGGVSVVNLFAWRSRSPADLTGVSDSVGPLNDEHISEAAGRSGAMVVAWGNGGALRNPASGSPRCLEVGALLRQRSLPVVALDQTGQGQPRHPLYVPRDTAPVPWPDKPSLGSRAVAS